MEAKMPFLFLIFPPWLETKYPEIMKNVRTNTNRLMTLFDVHEMLKDILHFNGRPRVMSPTARGISLFSEIPLERNCTTAGIPATYCLCSSSGTSGHSNSQKKVPSIVTELLVTQFTKEIVTKTKKLRKRCVKLKFEKSINIFKMVSEIKIDYILYNVMIQMTPGNGIFEASMSFNPATKKAKLIGDISRLNLYRGQAECISQNKLRPFCYCSK